MPERTAPLPRCPGTVVVHRDDAVTCTSGTCQRDRPKGIWLSIHSKFVYCAEALGGAIPCPDCGFEAPTAAPRSRLQYARLVGHPSTWSDK